MLNLFIISVGIGFMVGYPIGKFVIAPRIMMRRIQTLKNEMFIWNLATIAEQGKGLTPER